MRALTEMRPGREEDVFGRWRTGWPLQTADQSNSIQLISYCIYTFFSHYSACPHAISSHPVTSNRGTCGGLSGGLANLHGEHKGDEKDAERRQGTQAETK